jgi:hypothetical protein
MGNSAKQPLLYGHLDYSIRKLVLGGGKGIAPAGGQGIGAQVVQSQTEPGIFYMDLPAAFTRRNFRLLHEWEIKGICYQVFHTPSRTLSPIYDHDFNEDPLKRVGGLSYIGPMKLFPAEGVWPELTRKGYYGELPQFYT